MANVYKYYGIAISGGCSNCCLETFADPEHEEHENILAWRGPFDTEAFSLDRD